MKIQLHSSYLFVEITEIDKTNVKHHPNEPINLRNGNSIFTNLSSIAFDSMKTYTS